MTTANTTPVNSVFRPNRSFLRACALLVVCAFLAACSSSVVREGGNPGRSAVASTPKYGASAVVQRGDTLYRIASSNGIAMRDLAAWNRLSPPYTIYPGQRLQLYPGGATAGRTPAARPSAAAAAPRPRPAGAASSAPAGVPVNSGLDWRWPAQGALLNAFVAGEPTRQGIDIGGTGGSPVNAAADGVVVYSGSGLVGYGELIIIKHTEQWLSAYGHNRNRLVAEGQQVKVGQQIAELGRSGAARDMLHFEVRYNGKPVDPLLHLPKR